VLQLRQATEHSSLSGTFATYTRVCNTIIQLYGSGGGGGGSVLFWSCRVTRPDLHNHYSLRRPFIISHTACRTSPRPFKCVCVCVLLGIFHINRRPCGDFHRQTGDIQLYQPETSPVCKMLYFVGRVHTNLWSCRVSRWCSEIPGRIGFGLWLVFGRISPVDMICKYECV